MVNVLQLALLLVMVGYAEGFLTGCQEFNPMNFNQCFTCCQGYYVDAGKCKVCTVGGSNVKECQQPAAGIDNKTEVSSKANSTSGPAQLQTKQGALVQNAVQTKSTVQSTSSPSPQASSSSSSSSSTTPSSSSSSSSSSTPSSSTSSSSTTPSASTSSSPSPSSTDLMSQLQMIMGLLPQNCISLGFFNNGISCNKCKEGFNITNSNTCLKIQEAKVSLKTQSGTNSTTVQPIVATTLSQLYQSTPPSTLPSTVTQQSTIPPVQSSPTTQTVQSSPTTQTVQSSASSQTVQTSPQPTPPPVRYPSPTSQKDLNCMILNPSYSLSLPISKSNARCQTCYPSFYYNSTIELCMMKNPLCKTCDNDNKCQSCYPGYILFQDDCRINSGKISLIVGSANPAGSGSSTSQSSTTGQTARTDPNCQEYDHSTQACLTCAYKYYPDPSTKICTQVDPNCKSWDQLTGICSTCYTGSIVSPSNPKLCQAVASDPSASSLATPSTNSKAYCRNITNGICLSCVGRYFLFKGDCYQVSDMCKTYNPSFGYCTSCYDGYSLTDGDCQQIVAAIVRDPFCQYWQSGRCQECLMNYYPSQKTGKCTLVSLLCNGYDKSNGHCTNCIQPYQLNAETGECVFLY